MAAWYAKNRHFETNVKREEPGPNKNGQIYHKRAHPWHHHQNNTSVANHDDKLFNQMLITIIEPIITYTPSLFPSQGYRFLSFRVEVFAIFDILLRLNVFSEA